ncbi:diguanylate cyclase domain-containing protein [Halioxenophilus sp. WMMB6]|uniref:diguanylate cyclase domain-containing protein n=1 Tax=Halioxenophilus sp. WMMB6 TaxID=3073815 RepID=UPI00295E6A30|nr:diguanylate cyclase [Halioxenophilus sp. WMMB6]
MSDQPEQLTAAVRALLHSDKTVLQAVINAVPTPIFFKDDEGRYLGCNRAFENYVGLTREALVGRSVFELFEPELARVYHEADSALLQAGGEQVYEARVKYADGSIRDVMFHKAVFEAEYEGISGLVGVILDITERKKIESEYRQLALTDTVTRIDNRFSFMRSAEAAMGRLAQAGNPVSLMLIDLDDFKGINDNHGHFAGDTILREVAQRLRQVIQPNDMVARIGGDEFAVLLPDTQCPDALASLAAKLIEQSARPIATGDQQICTGVSIGIACAPHHATNVTALLRCADQALYQAKSQGKNCFHLFNSDQPAANQE